LDCFDKNAPHKSPEYRGGYWQLTEVYSICPEIKEVFESVKNQHEKVVVATVLLPIIYAINWSGFQNHQWAYFHFFSLNVNNLDLMLHTAVKL
jgi:hypothetical protein